MEDKNEILAKIEGLKELFEEKFDVNDADHEKILAQTTKTNGNVSELQNWRNQIMGAYKLLLFFGLSNIIILVIFIYRELVK